MTPALLAAMLAVPLWSATAPASLPGLEGIAVPETPKETAQEPPPPSPFEAEEPAPVPAPKAKIGFYKGNRFSFRYDARWEGPHPIEGGVKVVLGRASSAAAFLPKSSPRYLDPPAMRKLMRERQRPGDGPALDIIRLRGRLGSRVRYTSHEYKGKELLFEKSETLYTEMIMVPDPQGVFVIKFEAPKADFEAVRPSHDLILRTIELPKIPGYEPDPYYKDRDNLVQDLIPKTGP